MLTYHTFPDICPRENWTCQQWGTVSVLIYNGVDNWQMKYAYQNHFWLKSIRSWSPPLWIKWKLYPHLSAAVGQIYCVHDPHSTTRDWMPSLILSPG